MAGRSPESRQAGGPASADVLDGLPGMLPTGAFGCPGTLPDVLSALLRQLEESGATSDAVCRALIARLPRAPAHLAAALLDVAAAADKSGLGNAYHNPTHSRDVGVVFANLLRLHAHLADTTVEPIDLLVGCCAAFGHDLGHDGRDVGADEPFRLETIAADAVGAIMEAHRVEAYHIDRVYCAIMATEIRNGYRALDDARTGAASAGTPACLLGLWTSRTSLATASLLRDADVMQSAGLTPLDHDRQTARLEKERGLPTHAMGTHGADFFLRDVIRGRFLSNAGRVFQPRLDHLLQLNALRAAQGRGGEGLAALDP